MTTGRDHQGAREGTTDAALIERSRSDPELFAAVFDRHGPAIDRYVRRRLGVEPADDVVADTFMTAVPAPRWLRPGPS